MTDGTALVSVIVPAYDDGRWIGEALESILRQTRRADEVIVVDDGSTDDTAAVVARYGPPVRYERQTHAGAGAARNRGVEMAQGDYLAFLDADDLWMDDKLERQLAALAAEPGLDALFGHIQQFESAEPGCPNARHVRFVGEVLPGFVPDTLLIRAEAFRRIGPLREGLSVGEFLPWFASAVDRGLSFRMAPDVVARRRVHTGNSGTGPGGDPRTAYARVLFEVMRRRRGEAPKG